MNVPENVTPEDERQDEQPKQVDKRKTAHEAGGLPVAQQEAIQALAKQIVREAGLQAED